MIRHFSATILVFGLAGSITGAEPDRSAAVTKAAEEMGAALRRGDYKKVIDYMYPKAVAAFGGREKMAEMMENGMKDMEKRGTKIVSFTFGKPGDFHTEGDNAFVVIPETIKMQVPQGKLLAKSYLLGISSDGGKTWKFLDGAGMDKKDAVEKVLPKLPAKLKLPEKQKPVLIKDD